MRPGTTPDGTQTQAPGPHRLHILLPHLCALCGRGRLSFAAQDRGDRRARRGRRESRVTEQRPRPHDETSNDTRWHPNTSPRPSSAPYPSPHNSARSAVETACLSQRGTAETPRERSRRGRRERRVTVASELVSDVGASGTIAANAVTSSETSSDATPLFSWRKEGQAHCSVALGVKKRVLRALLRRRARSVLTKERTAPIACDVHEFGTNTSSETSSDATAGIGALRGKDRLRTTNHRRARRESRVTEQRPQAP